jgi:preprotein translocase subunit SecD
MTTKGTQRPLGRRRFVIVAVAVAVAVGVAAVAISSRSPGHPDTAAAGCTTGPVDTIQLVAGEGSASSEQLTRAAAILRRRLAAYGCAAVGVDGQRLRVSARRATMSHLDELIAPGQLQFREVLEVYAGDNCTTDPGTTPADTDVTACGQDGTEKYHLAPAQLVSSDVKGATPQQDQQQGAWQVILSFTSAGQRTFTDLTRQLIGKQMAIVLDGVVITAPSIEEQIDGDAQITGSFTRSSAAALSRILDSGPLPVALRRTWDQR